MSVIHESLEGDEIVCIERFSALPDTASDDPKARRTFRVGQRVRYMGFFRDARLSDNPAGWMVRFRTDRGQTFAATQTCFLTVAAWNTLARHLGQQEIAL